MITWTENLRWADDFCYEMSYMCNILRLNIFVCAKPKAMEYV
uniref:Uncharacterized protein n=1 Tax=Arundo donax TaxID=35708 RepID=A0A0A9UJ34_ARUDO